LGSFTRSLALLLALQLPAGATQTVSGRVVRPGDHRMDPIAGMTVTLHRVGSDAQGPLDSIRTDAHGRFSFHYKKTGSDDAIYFVSGMYRGIAYFTPPLQKPDVSGLDAEITVFDTTSRHVPVSVRGHHLVISAVDANGMRSIVEVYDLVNDSSVTKVATGNGLAQAVWSAPLLPGATGAAARDGDFPTAAISFAEGRVSVYAPFAPGLKQVGIDYSLPARQFPLEIPVMYPTGVLEVMLEEKSGTAKGAGLKEVDPVNVEQRGFRRFLASDAPLNSVATIDLPPPPAQTDPRYLVVLTFIIGAVMIAVLARALKRK
jgi:5-hydroxyisourate hydrolase-like protein (transthyretin family)